MAVNKVVFGAVSIMDISDSTVTPETLAEGKTAYQADGEKITGTMQAGLDTSDATATASDIIKGQTAYVNGKKVTGTLTKRTQILSINHANADGVEVGKVLGSDGIVRLSMSYHTKNNSAFDEGTYVNTVADFDNFGDAVASDVAKGKTFTSVAGLLVVGTKEESTADPTLNAEVQTIADVTAPTATFNGIGGTYKVYGFGKGRTSGYTTPQYAFCGDKYYTMASWGSPSSTAMTISVDESGNISGLPSLTDGDLTIVRMP